MKKSLQSLVLLLMALIVPATAMAAYDQLAEGVYQDGTTLYITSGVTSLGDLQVNPSEIYCYATIPPACMANTFAGYDAVLHVPAAGMVSYFTTLYWYNFNNILSDAIEPLSVTINAADVELEIGQQLSLSAIVAPSDATPKTVYWSSSDASVATVSAGGTVTAVATGECDIFATCVDKEAVCHVTIVPPRVTITLDKHEARLLPNHTITLTATCSPIDVDLAVTTSNPGVAIPRLVNGTIMVVGVAEGFATITVNAADGWSNPDSCVVSVYTEPGDVNCDGYVNISDVTKLIDYLLSSPPEGLNLDNADVNNDGGVNISDVTILIDYLLSGRWPWEPDEPVTETFTVNGVSFKMVYVEGGTFTMGASDNDEAAFECEKPAHKVTLSSYCIGQTEVTQALWLAVMGSNPSNFKGDLNRPVEQVSWNDCQLFISILNDLTGLSFRLPSEAEWEYAARGGNKSQGYVYSGGNTIDDVAWYWFNLPKNPNGTASQGPQPVATKTPNELGIYDMSGNLWEWCQDWYGNYSREAQINPISSVPSIYRPRRGGCWYDGAGRCRVSSRDYYDTSEQYYCNGLRLALDVDSTKFILSKSVVEIEVGEHLSVDLQNGSGDYSIYCDTTNCVECEIDDNKLIILGINKGITSIILKDNMTRSYTTITVIVSSSNSEIFVVNGVQFKMIKVEGGTFTMGATSEQGSDPNNDEYPSHQVTVSSYCIGETEVTQALWQAVMGSNPSDFTLINGYVENLSRPVEMVSWNDCQSFIAKLNELTGKNFRLPTEAEWEYAARGGKNSRGYKYAGSNDINEVAWYFDNIPSQSSGNEGYGTQPVATKAPNELGLYDMSGNVWEWCQDLFGSYSGNAQTNPTGPTSGSYHSRRSGGWSGKARYCRVSSRSGGFSSTTKASYLGLRLAL